MQLVRDFLPTVKYECKWGKIFQHNLLATCQWNMGKICFEIAMEFSANIFDLIREYTFYLVQNKTLLYLKFLNYLLLLLPPLFAPPSSLLGHLPHYLLA